MTYDKNKKLGRREFLKKSAVTTGAFAVGLGNSPVYSAKSKPASTESKKKVIVIGIDGMDPRLSEKMMDSGKLPNFNKLRIFGGYKRLGTSIPPQSPVAWANFITGAGPGTHGIYGFVKREPQNPCKVTNSIASIKPGIGIAAGRHFLMLRQPKTVLGRQGVPFWDYLDRAGVSSAVYLVPSNYPPSRSKYGHHRSLSGMGTPDLMGTLTTYQYFTEDGPDTAQQNKGGIHSGINFKNDSAQGQLQGPVNYFLRKSKPSVIKFSVHRDLPARAAVIEIQGRRILLKERQWSDWVELDFEFDMPVFMPDKHLKGICRIYLQNLAPTFRLYISPININPADPTMTISEPADFSKQIAKEMGLFYTIGFNEDFKARNNNLFTDEEYATQTEMVLQTRLKLLDYALKHYDDGLLFFYFSSTDLQSHLFWWDSDEKHPYRSKWQAMKYHNHIKKLYRRMDDMLGSLLKRYGDEATIIAMSDHGFSHYIKHFGTNAWLRDNGYIRPSRCTALCPNQDDPGFGVNWNKTRAYGIGFNDLYLNLEGREENGIVKPEQREALLQELITKLQAVRDVDGGVVIQKVYRGDQVYSGPAMKYAPDLVLGFKRGYKARGKDSQAKISPKVLAKNTDPWTADHCFAAEEVPGVLFSNRPVRAEAPSLIDLAPTILAEFGLNRPDTMEGRNVFAS